MIISGKVTSYQKIKAGFFPEVESSFFLSLVPTQLRVLIKSGIRAIEWLSKYQIVFVGGAPLDLALWRKALSYSIQVVPVYGMSETAAMVARAFYKENQPLSYEPLCSVTVDVMDNILTIETNALGRFTWDANLYSDPKLIDSPWVTQDRGKIDRTGAFQILGRNDRAIMSGGITIFPEKLESLLAQYGFDKVFFLGVPDPHWGEKLVGLADLGLESQKSTIFKILSQNLTKAEIPKDLYFIKLPQNDRGKNDIDGLRKCAFSLAKSSKYKK